MEELSAGLDVYGAMHLRIHSYKLTYTDNGYGDCNGDGYGNGNCNGDGYGNCNGNGNGNCNGDGD